MLIFIQLTCRYNILALLFDKLPYLLALLLEKISFESKDMKIFQDNGMLVVKNYKYLV